MAIRPIFGEVTPLDRNGSLPMNPEATPWITLILGVLGFLGAVWLYDRIASALASRPRIDDDPSPGRSITGAAFALQQIFDPGIEHVIRAENDLEEDDADPGGGGDDPPSSESLQTDWRAVAGHGSPDSQYFRAIACKDSE